FRSSGVLSRLSLSLLVVFGDLWAARASAQSSESLRLRLSATVPQIGPVGYRDPLGVISPDGDWLAFTSGGWLRVTHTAGGPIHTLARFVAIRSITWRADGRTIAAFALDTLGSARWVVVDATTGATRDAWAAPFPGSPAVDPRSFFSVAWSS